MAATIVSPARARTANFARFAWGVLAWNLLDVLWGAFVRASGSGAGCGSHWPLCNGEVVPLAPQLSTIIEFTHRVLSGIALVAVAALWLWSRMSFPRGDRVRKMAGASALFLVLEALLGAGLVLFDLDKQSLGHAFYLSLHLANTLLLLGALALTAWLAREDRGRAERRSRLTIAALLIAILVCATGGIAALGDTLFPAASLAQGIRQDFSGAASFLLRLRILHPAFAVLGALYFIAVSIMILRSKQSAMATKLAVIVVALALTQLAAGAVNIVLLAPVWMQITHLLLADLVWIALVLLAVEASPRVLAGKLH